MQLLRKMQSQFTRLDHQQIFFWQIFNVEICFSELELEQFYWSSSLSSEKLFFQVRQNNRVCSSSNSHSCFAPRLVFESNFNRFWNNCYTSLLNRSSNSDFSLFNFCQPGHGFWSSLFHKKTIYDIFVLRYLCSTKSFSFENFWWRHCLWFVVWPLPI